MMNKHVFIAVLLAFFAVIQVAAQEKRARLTVDLGDFTLAKNVSLSGTSFQENRMCDSSNIAVFEFPLEEGDYFTLNIAFSHNPLYLEPGKPLSLKVVTNSKGEYCLQHFDLQCEGDNADKNIYLNERQMNWMQDSDFLLDEKAYLKKLKQYEKQNRKTVLSYRLDKDFEQKELLTVRYRLHNPLTSYPVQHFWKDGNQAYGLWKQDETPLVKEYIPRLLEDDVELWKNAAYREYVSGAIAILALKDFGVDWETVIRQRVEVLEMYFKNPVILEDMVQKYAIIYTESTQGAPLKGVQEIYDRYVKREDYKEELRRHRAVYEKLQNGNRMLSEGAVYYDVDGNAMNLEDLRGKYLYIDVWATWCGPCRQEIPHLKKLEERFHGKNIHFVSISIDSRRKDWVEMVRKEQLGGIQLIGGPEAQIAVDYKITGVPRFLLFDPEGKLIDKNMTRPSDPETVQKLEQLKGI